MVKPRTYGPDGAPERRSRRRRDPDGAMNCAWPGCTEAARHRAPVSRQALDQYLWFCKIHAREYNRSWDFFRGMSRDEILSFQDRNATWHRPTWRIGGKAAWPDNLDDPFGLFPKSGPNGPRNGHAPARSPWTRDERQALATLGLDEAVTFEEIRSRYKMLVKRWHPDANRSDPAAGDRLKRINAAYACLRNGVKLRSAGGTATV